MPNASVPSRFPSREIAPERRPEFFWSKEVRPFYGPTWNGVKSSPLALRSNACPPPDRRQGFPRLAGTLRYTAKWLDILAGSMAPPVASQKRYQVVAAALSKAIAEGAY